MTDNAQQKLVVQRKDRPIEFRTVMLLYVLLGLGVGLTIHFILLSTPTYNWIGG